MSASEGLQVVWFKRDLRLEDHAPLAAAANGRPTLLLYVFEPELINDPHYSERHWRFVTQSLLEMNSRLEPLNQRVYILKGSMLEVLAAIHAHHPISNLLSYEETGLRVTYERDKAISAWCRKHHVKWQEYRSDGVKRGRYSRDGWVNDWHRVMSEPLAEPEWEQLSPAEDQELYLSDYVIDSELLKSWGARDPAYQLGGVGAAQHALDSFFDERGKIYHKALSKPLLSRKHCSRLSPYLAWGNLSIRQVYQRLQAERGRSGWGRALSALNSRLHWHCHFIQKFESEDRIEFEPMNFGYHQFRDDYSEANEQVWAIGNTGIPYLDACLRCLQRTGYLHFRGRAMIVSALCHLMQGRWQFAARQLAQWFLDFEPGIHYAQIQMQVGLTGINTLRIYNPVKQGLDHDPDAVFIKKWVPELSELPVPLVHTPWVLGPIERACMDLNYPDPVIDITEAHKAARAVYWDRRQNPLVRQDINRVLYRHVETRTHSKKQHSNKGELR